MIIQCKNCNKKFTVKDADIPITGRTVQCGNCSTQWVQKPITPSIKTEHLHADDVNQDFLNKEFKASDNKNYKFLGNQWAEVLPSGKTGRLARKKISKELNHLAGRKEITKDKVTIKSSKTTNQYEKKNEAKDQYHEKEEGRMGVFSFLIVLLAFVAAIILLLDTFKNQLIPFFPNLENYLVYIFETLNNIYIIIKDLINNYK